MVNNVGFRECGLSNLHKIFYWNGVKICMVSSLAVPLEMAHRIRISKTQNNMHQKNKIIYIKNAKQILTESDLNTIIG